MALYMQNILGYSPFEAGLRFLPSTLVIIFAAPLAGRLTDRIGARLPIAVGLSLVALSLYMQSRITIDTTYDYLLPWFSVMGLGIGLVMSPMSTAAMNSVQVAKAGVGSGILSMSRMVGGTFGVAALGALFQRMSDTRLESRLGDLPLSPTQQSWFMDNLGSGQVAGRLHQLDPQTSREVGRVLNETFVHSLSTSLRLGAAVAAVGVAIAVLTIEGRPLRRSAAARVAAAAPAD
jgi:MFS family permease